MTVEELQSDAWIAADEIGKRRGREIDFADPVDQELVIGALNIRNVKRPEKHMWYADRIDQGNEDEEEQPSPWANRLHATEDSDPLVLLLQRESAIDAKEMLANSYSQATAYVMVFVHFKNDRQAVCAYLVISNDTLGRRVTIAADSVRVQPSLFDRIERIDSSFMPRPGRQYVSVSRIEQDRESSQFRLDF